MIYTLIWVVILYFVYTRFKAAFWLYVQIYIATMILLFVFLPRILIPLIFNQISSSILPIVIFVSLLILLCYYFYKRFVKIIPTLIASDYESRTKEQQRVIRYFLYNGSILSKGEMKDEEYDALLKNYLDKTDFKKRALNKFDLDESDITEIKPAKLENFYFEENDYLSKRGKDGKFRCSAFQVSWVFATNDKFLIYSNTFHLDNDVVKETVNEYYWKDIDRITISNETRKITSYNIPSLMISPFFNDMAKKISTSINYNTTLLTVSSRNEKIERSINEMDDSQERTFRGLKSKLDEKKKE